MKWKLALLIGLISFNFTTVNFAEKTPTSSNQKISTRTIAWHEKDFSFNWNNYTSIAPNKTKVSGLEDFLGFINDPSALSSAERNALGKLYYKLATFYTHILGQPDLAIASLKKAEPLVSSKQEKAWLYNHLAYAYEQKFAATGNATDKAAALEYLNKVFHEYGDKKNKEIAFAECIKGLLLSDTKDYTQAEVSFKKAITIYKKLSLDKDEQSARAKNRLASIMLEKNSHDPEALAMLEELKDYWFAKGSIGRNPYAARNSLTLGKAYLTIGDAQAAESQFKNALRIYESVYGKDSPLLAAPCRLLAAALSLLGKTQQAALYQQRATLLDTSSYH